MDTTRDRRRHRAAIPCLVQVLWLIVAPLAHGADYAREKKWADEITPRIVVGDPVYLPGRAGHRFLALYTEAATARAGLVIVHGNGVHPDWGLIGTLRSALADHGYTTLSVQMPVLAPEARGDDYLPTFGEAAERLARAVDFLRARGAEKVAVVSHSLGSRMTYHYLTRDPSTPVGAWVCIGWGGSEDFSRVNVPVLDLYGENDLPAVLRGAKSRVASIDAARRSQQIMAPGTDHFFANQQAELVRYVRNFLDTALGSHGPR